MAEENRIAFENTPSSCSSPRTENPDRSPTCDFDSCFSTDPLRHQGRVRASSWDDSDDNLPPVQDFSGSKTCRIFSSDDRKPKKSVFSEINELKKEFFKTREQEKETVGKALEGVRDELEKQLIFDRRQTPGRIRRRSRSSSSSSPVGELESQASPHRTNKSSGSEAEYLPDLLPMLAPSDATYYINNFFTELKSRRISMMDPISQQESVVKEINESSNEKAGEEGDEILCKTSRKLSQILEVEETRRDLEKIPEENVTHIDLFEKCFSKPEESEFSPLQTARSKKSEDPEEEKKQDDSDKPHDSEYFKMFHKPYKRTEGCLSERTHTFFDQPLDNDYIVLSAKSAKTRLSTPECLVGKDDTTPVHLFSPSADGSDKCLENKEENARESLKIDLMKLMSSEDTTPRKSTCRSENSFRANSGKARTSCNESPKFMLKIERDSARSLNVNVLYSQRRDVSEQCDVFENDPESKPEEIVLKTPSLESVSSPQRSPKVQEEMTSHSKNPSSRRSQVKKKKLRSGLESDSSVQASGGHSQVISYRNSERTHKTSRTGRSSGKSSHESEAPDSPNSRFGRMSKSQQTNTTESRITETPRSNRTSDLNPDLSHRSQTQKLSHRSSKSVGTITRDSDRQETKQSSHRGYERSLGSRSRHKEQTAATRNSSPHKSNLVSRSNGGRSTKSSLVNQEEIIKEIKKLEGSLRAASSEESRSPYRENRSSRSSSPNALKLTSRSGASRKSSLENREAFLGFEIRESSSRESRRRHREHTDSRTSSPIVLKLTARTHSGSPRRSRNSLENLEEFVTPVNLLVASAKECRNLSPFPFQMSPRANSGRNVENRGEFVNLERFQESTSRESEKVDDTPSNHSSNSSGSNREDEMPEEKHSQRSEAYSPEPDMSATVESERLSRRGNSSRTSVGSNFTEMDSPVRSTTKSRPNSYTSKGPDQTQEPISGRSNTSVTYEDEDLEESYSTHGSKLGDESGRFSSKRLSVIDEVSYEDLEASSNTNEEKNAWSPKGMSPGKGSLDEAPSTELARPEEDEWKELIDKFKSSPNSINFPGFPRPKDKSLNSMVEYSKKPVCDCDGNAGEKMFPRSRFRERMAKAGERNEKLEESFDSIDLAYRDSLLGKTKQDGLTFQIPQQIYHVNLETGGPYGIGEFGDVPCWNAGDLDPKDLEKPKEHGDGIPSKRIPEGFVPNAEKKDPEVRDQSRDDFRESTLLLFSEVQEDSDFAHVIPCRMKTSKSDNCINRKVSERQILPDSYPNRSNYKSEEMDFIEFEENRKTNEGKSMSKSTINQNSSSESLGYEKYWENLEFEYERTPRLSRSLSNLDVLLQSHRDQCEILSISGSELFKSTDIKTENESTDLKVFPECKAEEDKAKSNWLKLRQAETKSPHKPGKRAKTKFRKRGSPSPNDYLISSRKGRPSVTALKLRNPNCFQNFYKRFISVFCLTSSSSAATSK